MAPPPLPSSPASGWPRLPSHGGFHERPTHSHPLLLEQCVPAPLILSHYLLHSWDQVTVFWIPAQLTRSFSCSRHSINSWWIKVIVLKVKLNPRLLVTQEPKKKKKRKKYRKLVWGKFLTNSSFKIQFIATSIDLDSIPLLHRLKCALHCTPVIPVHFSIKAPIIVFYICLHESHHLPIWL